MSKSTKTTLLGGLTFAAVMGAIALNLFLQGQKPVIPQLVEQELTWEQRQMRTEILSSHSAEIGKKTSDGTPVYFVKEPKGGEWVTFRRPAWLANDGSVVLTDDEQEKIALETPKDPPTWFFWWQGTTSIKEIRTFITSFQVVLLLCTISGLVSGFMLALYRAEPGWWWVVTSGINLPLGLFIGFVWGTLATAQALMIFGGLIFTMVGALFFVTLRSLENWPPREEPKSTKQN